jgi:hypothetical protein
MAEDPERGHEQAGEAAQKRVGPFLDCVAYVLAKRWLRDQRHEQDKPLQEGPDARKQ